MGKFSKSRGAQNLVEFALVIPIMMIILLIIIEFGYAIYARIILTEATKQSLTRVNQLYNQPGDAATKLALITEEVRDTIDNHLAANGILYSGAVEVNIIKEPGSPAAILTAYYTYYPAFLLPNIFGGDIIPTEIPISSTQIINSAVLEPNLYVVQLTTANLSSFTTSSYILNPYERTFLTTR